MLVFIQKMMPLVLSLFSFISLTFCNYSANLVSQPPSEPPPAQLQGGALPEPQQGGGAAGSLVITMDYARQSGSASNQFAIWIEDANHEYVTTLYATRYTANGGYSVRPDSIKDWVAKSNLAQMDKTEVDAISGATPAAGSLTYTWDLTDANGDRVPNGTYIFIVEGTLRWKNQVIYTGAIEVGGNAATAATTAADAATSAAATSAAAATTAAAATVISPEPQFTFEGAGNQPALNADSTETNMLTNVTATYTP